MVHSSSLGHIQIIPLATVKSCSVIFVGTRPLKYDGIQYNQGFDDYGMRLYRLNIEQIISIVETVELGNAGTSTKYAHNLHHKY